MGRAAGPNWPARGLGDGTGVADAGRGASKRGSFGQGGGELVEGRSGGRDSGADGGRDSAGLP